MKNIKLHIVTDIKVVTEDVKTFLVRKDPLFFLLTRLQPVMAFLNGKYN